MLRPDLANETHYHNGMPSRLPAFYFLTFFSSGNSFRSFNYMTSIRNMVEVAYVERK